MFDGWDDGKANKVRDRHAPRFAGWESDNSIFERVVEALQIGGREPPPKPNL